MKYRPDIDGLRTLAVVPVVIFHAEKSIVPGGFIGVDIFFVISGYLISLILLADLTESRFSLVNFYEKRARRILPSLLFVLAATLIVAYFVIGPEQYITLSRSALATLGFSSNIWFWFKQGDYFAASSETEALLHTWSLAVEEQFYLFYPIILAIIIKRRWRPLPMISVLSAASFVLSVWGLITNPLATFYLIPTRAWELGVGCIIAILTHQGALRPGNPKIAVGMGAAGLALIVSPIILYTSLTPFPGLAALPPCLGAAFLISAGAMHARNPVSRLLALEPLRQVGLISYSLYLWHWPIMAFARVATGENELPLGIAAITVLLSFVLAWFTTYKIENIFRARSRISSAAIFSLSAVGMAAVAVASFAVISTAGLPLRMTPQELQILDAARFDTAALPNRCNSSRPLTDDGCRLGNDNGDFPEFMLWGDSHAGSLSPAVEKVALTADRHGRLAWLVGCPPVLGVYTNVPGNEAYCPSYNNKTLQYLKDHPSIKIVLLHARWALYATGTYPERDDAKLQLFQTGGPSTPSLTNEQILRVGLERTVAAIRALGRQVVIIEGVPELSFDPLAALYASEAFGAPSKQGPLRSTTESRNALADDILNAIAAANNARVVSIIEDLCNDICRTEYEGGPAFRDSNHISPQAATSVVFRALERKKLFDPQ